MGARPRAQGKDKGKGKNDGKSAPAKKVFTVRHGSGFDSVVECPPADETFPDQEGPQKSHFAMVVHMADSFECMQAVHEAVGFMILDTACQRSCCGTAWIRAHTEKLNELGLKTLVRESQEKFQFGSGQPLISERHVFLPAGVNGKCMILGANILPTKIPYLGSFRLLEQLGGILDIPILYQVGVPRAITFHWGSHGHQHLGVPPSHQQVRRLVADSDSEPPRS